MKRILCILSLFIFFSIVAFPQSDLIWYGTVTINPAAPNVGDSVKFTAVVRATIADSKAFTVKGGIDGTELFSKNCPALLKTTKNTVTFTWIATAGDHTVYFEIDPNQTSGDINYNNNYIEVPFSVGTGTTPPPPPRRRGQQPNLIVKKVTWNPQAFSQGDKIDFQIVVANTGGGPSPITYAYLDIDGNVVQSCHISPLQPGQSDNVPATATITQCPMKVLVQADATNLAQESDESDNFWNQVVNCGYAIIQPNDLPVTTELGRRPKRPKIPGDPGSPEITIGGTPNLVPSNIDWTPKTFTEGQKVTFTYSAKNIGNGIAKPRPSLSFTAQNGQAKVQAPGAQGSTLYPGDSMPLRKFAWTSKCNSKVEIAVDSEGLIVETDEADNFWSHIFSDNECKQAFIPDTPAKNLPNIRVAGIGLKYLKTSFGTGVSYNLDLGGDIPADISVNIKNYGSVPAQAFKYQLIINNDVILTKELALNPNQEVTLGWYAKVKCGSVFLFKADIDNIVAESIESDNEYQSPPWPKCD